MHYPAEETCQKKIITIPNILSFLRLCLIPVMVWLYCFEENYTATTLVLLLSGLTDIADGIIARRFHMVSDFGKAFDPVADKLTQAAMLLCLLSRFPAMGVPLAVLAVKEIGAGITGLVAIRKTGTVLGAAWHGKAATVCLYTMMAAHLIWPRIPAVLSYMLIGLCTALLVVSAVLYGLRYIRFLGSWDREGAE